MSKSKFSNVSELFKGLRVYVIGSLFFLISLLSCQMPSLSQKYQNCDKGNSVEFKACINRYFPIGSSFSDLKFFLESQGFTLARREAKASKNSFYFFWKGNDLLSYKVIVVGNYSDDLKIIKISAD